MKIARHRRSSHAISFLNEFLQYMVDVYHRQRWQNTRVDLPVANETGLLSERFAAYVARIDTLAGVQKEMLAQAAVSGERSAANRATIRLIARVDPHVLSQVIIFEKGLAALLTH